MQTKDATFIQANIEKLILVAAFLVLLGTSGWLYVSKPYYVTVAGQKRPMSEVEQKINAEAKNLESQMQSSTVAPFPEIDLSKTAVELASDLNLQVVPKVQAINSPVDVLPPGTIDTWPPVYVPSVPSPTNLSAQVGTIVLAKTTSHPAQDCIYVSIQGQFDLEKWRRSMVDAGHIRPANFDHLNDSLVTQGCHIAGVYLLREMWNGHAYVNRQRVNLVDDQLCYDMAYKAPDFSVDAQYGASKALVQQILDNQSEIVSPYFPALEPGTPLPPSGVRPAAKVVSDVPDSTAAKVSDLGSTVVVRAHDLTAEPSRRYRYKLCVALLNPVYGFRGLAPVQIKENATRVAIEPAITELESPDGWVEVNVPSNLYAFCRKIDNGRVTFTVFKTFNGQWESLDYEVKPGQMIGDSAAVVQLQSNAKMRIPLDMDTHSMLVAILDMPDPTRPNKQATATAVVMESDGTLTVRYPLLEAESPDWLRIQAALKASRPAVTPTPPVNPKTPTPITPPAPSRTTPATTPHTTTPGRPSEQQPGPTDAPPRGGGTGPRGGAGR